MTVSVPLEVFKASEIEQKKVQWLCYPYIPFGKVTLLQGDPGDGKSKLMLSIASLLSKNDVQTTTQPGDIVLYSGNQLVIFFGSNSWSYTRLSHIEGLSTDELTALLDKDVAVIEIKTAKITIDHKGLGLSQK